MDLTLAQLNEAGAGLFPGHIGVEIETVEDGVVRGRMELGDHHLAPNGYLHAAAVIGLADTACGYGCILSLPEGGVGFTTIELKTNFMRSASEGTITCEARLVHGGGTTQLWDATVNAPDGRLMALFPLHAARASRALRGPHKMSLESPGRAGRREAAFSVAPIVGLSTLPASLPRDAHRTRSTKRHSVRTS